MISDIAAWLFALFVLDPIQAEIQERVERTNLPIQTIQPSQHCLATHGPRLLEQAGEDPLWAFGSAVGIANGWTSPVQLLDNAIPTAASLPG